MKCIDRVYVWIKIVYIIMHILFMVSLLVQIDVMETFNVYFHWHLICFRFYKGVIDSFDSAKKKHKVIWLCIKSPLYPYHRWQKALYILFLFLCCTSIKVSSTFALYSRWLNILGWMGAYIHWYYFKLWKNITFYYCYGPFVWAII